ncbi:Hypothetical protein NTJ_06050 [Nesidiocoris tenuis]|uniref:Uncharacterized protein n=1 Tax=Nesidiocoris tenuis TaxID=355587 RepID=A0ABN7AQQ8_9HEMI|nr:Hypothetical protein NTJ_06050 [Nesidiocoris tenuis]
MEGGPRAHFGPMPYRRISSSSTDGLQDPSLVLQVILTRIGRGWFRSEGGENNVSPAVTYLPDCQGACSECASLDHSTTVDVTALESFL